MRLARQGRPMMHRTWLHTYVSRQPPLCPRAPSSRSPRRSELRCSWRSGARGTITCSPACVLLCAAGPTPTDIAAALFCSHSSVYYTVRAHREGTLGPEHDDQGRLAPWVCTTVLTPTPQRLLVVLLKAATRAHGWCRTRWSCVTLAAMLQASGPSRSRARRCAAGCMK
jgi:hypothetical protein